MVSIVPLLALAFAAPQVRPIQRPQVARPALELARSARVYVYDQYVMPGDQESYRLGHFDDFDGKGWTQTAAMRAITSLWVDAKGREFFSYWYGQTGSGIALCNAGFHNPSQTKFTGPLKRAMGIATDRQGRIYVVDAELNAVLRMDDISGAGLVSFGSAGNGIGQFKNPGAITIDRNGRIYVADTGNSRIVQFDSMTGEGWRTYDGQAYGGVGAQVQFPKHLAVDGKGRIYYLRPEGGKVVRIDDISGKGMVQYGQPGGVAGASRDTLLAQPGGVAVDAWDRVYVSDTSGKRVVRIDDMTGANRVEFWQVGQKAALERPTLLFVTQPRGGGGTIIR
jgi:streptogramin lyase